MKSLIIGNGEIGKSLYNILKEKYEETYIRDVEGLKLEGVDILHICFPYTKKFVDYVKKYQREYNPKFTIIHSTVPVGTSTRCNAFHSPVRGIHPHLEESLKCFVKYLAPASKELEHYFKLAGIDVKLVEKPETTELAKLYCTTIYGLNIIAEKECYNYCQKLGLDFDIVYTDCNKTYNEGYERLGFPQFKKYILEHRDGNLGGHCIQNNASILFEDYKSPMAEFVLSGGQAVREGSNPLRDRAWLFCEYYGRKKSTEEIGRELGYTGANVVRAMNKLDVPRRDIKWTEEEIKKIKRLAEDGKNLKEITDEFDDKRTYNAIRNVAYKVLKINSCYDPSVRDEETREKISATLQGIEYDDWNGFKESLNSLIRKSRDYRDWRIRVFERDNYTCQECGKNNCYLHAHHIKPFSKFPKLRFEVDNGITLCEDCHYNTHSKKSFNENCEI